VPASGWSRKRSRQTGSGQLRRVMYKDSMRWRCTGSAWATSRAVAFSDFKPACTVASALTDAGTVLLILPSGPTRAIATFEVDSTRSVAAKSAIVTDIVPAASRPNVGTAISSSSDTLVPACSAASCIALAICFKGRWSRVASRILPRAWTASGVAISPSARMQALTATSER
jgi:hypothetical protein